MFRWIILVACILAALLGLAVGVMNPDPVQARLPGFELELALGSLLILALVCGAVLGFVLCLILFYLPARLRGMGRTTRPKDESLPERNA